ncbi:hypothetical protein M2651_04200 [Clostridium sp. SYSU_GA19001]|nr:hypothetical protein [Clostridium caldaquaticum]MCM8710228.1 hypothetical protein [Clostridium caldaquaticum]
MRKIKIIIELIIIVILSIIIIQKVNSDIKMGKLQLREDIHNYIQSEKI